MGARRCLQAAGQPRLNRAAGFGSLPWPSPQKSRHAVRPSLQNFSDCRSALSANVVALTDEPAFVVTLDRATAEGQLPDRDGKRLVSGRLYVFLSQREVRRPMRGPSWFQPEPFFAVDVTTWPRAGCVALTGRPTAIPSRSTSCPPESIAPRRFWTTIFITVEPWPRHSYSGERDHGHPRHRKPSAR